MSTRERPLDLIRGGKNLSMGELTRMANAVERITTMQGSNLIQGANGLMVREPNTTKIWAKISAKDSSNPIKYTWEQVWPDGEGGWLEETDAPSGDDSSTPAYEGNGLDVDLTSPLYTELFIYNDSMLFFSPVAEGVVDGSGGSITVEEQDGTPSYTGITTIQVNQSDGMVLTQPGAGVALISIADASASSPGIVTIGTQTIAGEKTFTSRIEADNGVNLGNSSLLFGYSGGFPGNALISASNGGLTAAAFYYGSSIGSWQMTYDSGSNVSYFQLNTIGASAIGFRIFDGITTNIGQTGSYGGLTFTGGILTGGSFSGGSGTVTSVGITAPAAGIAVSGGPITSSGSVTLALADDLAALEALTGTNTLYYRSGTSTWSAVTIGSGISFSGGALSRVAIGARAYATSDQTISGGGWAEVLHGTSAYDTTSIYSSAGSTSRMTVPSGYAGKWRFAARVAYYNSGSSGVVRARLYLNGTTEVDYNHLNFTSGGLATFFNLHYTGVLSVGDHVRVECNPDYTGDTLGALQYVWFEAIYEGA